MQRIAVIGAGLAGLTVARELQDHAAVTLFDKSATVGGRMASRHSNKYHFDHGARFFTIRTSEFRAFLNPYINSGHVCRWDARFVEMDRHRVMASRRWVVDYPHFVATPDMNSLCCDMADGLDLHTGTAVKHIQRRNQHWKLVDSNGKHLDPFDWVVCAIPAAQCHQLMPDGFEHAATIELRQMTGCYSLMLGFQRPLPLEWDAALVKNADISWISVNSSKPGRKGGYALLAHATNHWADAHIKDELQYVQDHLMKEVSDIIDHDTKDADHIDLHRWRYANIDKQSGDASLVDVTRQLVAVGDWCIQGRVESAFPSGRDAAQRLRSQLNG